MSFCWIGIQYAMLYSQKYTLSCCFFRDFCRLGWVFSKIIIWFFLFSDTRLEFEAKQRRSAGISRLLRRPCCRSGTIWSRMAGWPKEGEQTSWGKLKNIKFKSSYWLDISPQVPAYVIDSHSYWLDISPQILAYVVNYCLLAWPWTLIIIRNMQHSTCNQLLPISLYYISYHTYKQQG